MNRTSLGLELLVSLDRADRAALHAQIEEQLRDAIRTGRLAPGTRLPSTRTLASELAVSRGVVVEAFGQLTAEGYLTVQRGAAPRVAAIGTDEPGRLTAAAPAAPRYDLQPGLPDLAAFPRAVWAAAVRRAAQTVPDGDLAYPQSPAHPAMQAALARYLGRVRGVAARPERIVAVHGVAQSMMLAVRALHRRERLAIAVEDPSHHRSRDQLRRMGVEVIPVPVDERGLVVAALPDRARAVLVTPAHQFPTGVVLAPERRAALVAWARRAGALVIEDDYDAEYRYDREPVGALQGLAPDRVAYAGSASKTLAPALRLAWLVLPAWLADAATALKARADGGSPLLDQLTFADFLARGELDRHLRRMRLRYRRRRDALAAALARHLPEVAIEGVAAGLHAVVRLPADWDEAAIVAGAHARGLGIQGLRDRAIAAPSRPTLLIGYANLPESAAEHAVAELARAVAGAAA